MVKHELGRWPLVVEIPVVWGDLDAFRHVNNTVFLRWFETARIAYFERIGITSDLERQARAPILARQAIDYRLPIKYPDVVRVATTVTRLGNTSLVMALRITSRAHSERVVAEGEGVIVMLNYNQEEKVPLDDELRTAILEFESTGPAENFSAH